MELLPAPLQALIFDVEGVIARPDRAAADRGLAALAPGLNSESLHRARNRADTYPLWQQFSIGAISREAYWGAILGSIGLPSEGEALATMLGIQSRTCWACIDEEMLALVDGLRDAGGLRLGILSNSAEDHEPFIARFEGRFHRAHFSHRQGRRKPDSEAFLLAAQALGVPPEATLFVDDKLRNTAAAEALGFEVWLFEDRPAFALELQRRGLRPADAKAASS
jgi:putative hydrolase of the HAD superfamily